MWSYFQNVLNWAVTNFDLKRFRKVMKGVDWALYYDLFKDSSLDTALLAGRISALIADGDVQKKIGIIPYVLTGDERQLDLRVFDDKTKLAAYERQRHCCAICGKEFDISQMEGDHITPWRDGGRTTESNCQMLCRECNRRKGAS